ncbi:P-loop containing nucleoside triphosphate hydrolase protein [Boletus edulis BED1]|uniref:RNA helicase n=1 Tax=Boletus edulis BED1 TaxID=1328754 RepID=A0AAD4C2G2_BOLED|nr:P-loop containing nucleoside triphosphate hydrolase protein [Boletus edulis BED1]
MEAFQLLSRGGARFHKQRFKSDVQLFTHAVTKPEKSVNAPVNQDSTLPPELDFFKYAQGGRAKRKAGNTDPSSSSAPSRPDVRSKRRKTNHETEDFDGNEDDGDDAPEGDALRERVRVTAKGSNVPPPIEVFDDLLDRFKIPHRLMSNLMDNHYKYPTGRRDLAAISPTGTGKTLSYLFPIMSLLGAPISSLKGTEGSGVRAILLAPTRELAHQIYNECLKLAVRRKWRVVLYSKATASTLRDKNARDKVDIVISTPLRLVASIQEGNLDLNNVRHLVLDEADRLLDSEFLAQVQEVISACTHPEIQKAVFSATLPAGAEQLAMGILRNPIRIVVGLKDTPLPLISQTVTYVADDASKLPSLLTYFAQPYNPPLLIFTSTQPRATSLAEELTLNGIANVDCLHAGMTKKERDDAVSRMRRGESWVMVSTEVMARGMDFKGVREVINYDFPTSVQSYIHRIGRTGRAGRDGKAVTYFTDEDAPYLKSIANVLLQSGSSVPDWILKLPKPSKLKKKQMGKIKRAETVNAARKIGRNDAIKKR